MSSDVGPSRQVRQSGAASDGPLRPQQRLRVQSHRQGQSEIRVSNQARAWDCCRCCCRYNDGRGAAQPASIRWPFRYEVRT